MHMGNMTEALPTFLSV